MGSGACCNFEGKNERRDCRVGVHFSVAFRVNYSYPPLGVRDNREILHFGLKENPWI